MIAARFPWRALLPVAVLIAGVAGAQAPPEATPAPPSATPAAPSAAPKIPRTLDVPSGALVAPGTAPELDLLYTGDVIGFLEPCG